jgi:hypothetical protein
VHLRRRRSRAGGLTTRAHLGHGLSVPVTVGPLVLRVVLLSAVPAVAGFAMMRAFLPEPGRLTIALVTTSAAITVVLELMLAGGLDMPAQLAVLVLAALAVPLILTFSRNPKAVLAADHARRIAPWMLSLAAAFAFVEFGRVWLGDGESAGSVIKLHTGLIVALAGLSWFALGLPRARVTKVIVLVEAALLGIAVVAGVAGTAQATVTTT